MLDDAERTGCGCSRLAPTVIVALSLSVVGFQLLGILHETYAGQPFFDSSARRLRMVSRVIAVAAVTAPILWSVANVEIAEEAVPSLDVPGHVDLVADADLAARRPRRTRDRRGVPDRHRAAARHRGPGLMPVDEPHRVVCRLDDLLEARGMTLTALAEPIGVTIVNLSVLKNQRAKAVRFSTLTALCDVLECQPGDLFSVEPAAG